MRPLAGVAASALLALSATAGCASAPGDSLEVEPGPPGAASPELLALYEDLGFVAGSPDLPVVGRLIFLKGPAESALLGLAASLPPSSLSFARDGELFSARYQVGIVVLADGDTVHSLSRSEVVRVQDLAETARTAPAIFFQEFFEVSPGTYTVHVTFRELTTREEVRETLTVNVPDYGRGGRSLSAPMVVLRAAARGSYAERPAAIFGPRATVTYGRAPSFLLIEDYAAEPAGVVVEIFQEGVHVWGDTVGWRPADGGPATVILTIPVSRVPPGLSEVRARGLGRRGTRSGPLLIALADGWASEDFDDALAYLQHALSPGELEEWRDAAPREWARLWTRFWRRTDPDPRTPANEFLREYFERMGEAAERFVEGDTPGWRTDRGQAYVQLGPPDRELRRAARRRGERPRLEWIWNESLPTDVSLVFEDESGFGIYRLTPPSRATLGQAAEQLRERRRSETDADTTRVRPHRLTPLPAAEPVRP